VNAMPVPRLAGDIGGKVLDPQECFNTVLETVAALQPPAELAKIKKYTMEQMQ
jgi:hypothetical protein